MLLALLCAAVLGSELSHALNHRLEGLAKPAVEPRQWRGRPWWFPSTATTTTTLTLTTPEQTSVPSPTPTGLFETVTGLTALATGLQTRLPDAGDFPSSSTVDRQPSSEAPVTDTMPTDTTASTGPQPTVETSTSSHNGDSGIGSNTTLVITLSTVLSVVGLALIAGALLCWRRRQRRLPFLPRVISPIDDDEIERWKSPRDEKARFQGGDTDVEADAALDKETSAPSHAKHPSTSSVKKPPSVIVYNRAYDGQGPARHSTDAESRSSFALNHPAYSGKTSFDKALPQTPIQARAPNARAGLTDESVPGDEPFIYCPKRTTSRLSKIPPSSASRRARHARARSSRSSTRSFGEYSYYGSGGGSGGSDLELSPRYSHDQLRHSQSQSHHSRNYSAPRNSHSRVYSSSSIPPRLSFGDDVLLAGLSPARPRFNGEGQIGRAIG